jgi:hypothetical protein
MSFSYCRPVTNGLRAAVQELVEAPYLIDLKPTKLNAPARVNGLVIPIDFTAVPIA